jgi:lysophospholipase L1-like esterase
MPMGASLVYGLESDDGNGFRLGLQNLLQKNGSTVTMLGTQKSGDMSQNSHEAYLAVTIDGFAKKASSSGAYDMNPNIVLLLLGVNDCWYMADEKHPEDSDPSIDKRTTDGKYTALRLATLLASIKKGFPDALVLASELPLNTNEWQDKCVRGFNDYLPTIVANATSQGQIIRYVNMYDAVPSDMIQQDGTHPTDEGYQLMAKRWFEATQTALGEVCGGKPATKTGANASETELDSEASSTSSGGQQPDETETMAPRPTLTLDSASAVGGFVEEGASWIFLPMALALLALAI